MREPFSSSFPPSRTTHRSSVRDEDNSGRAWRHAVLSRVFFLFFTKEESRRKCNAGMHPCAPRRLADGISRVFCTALGSTRQATFGCVRGCCDELAAPECVTFPGQGRRFLYFGFSLSRTGAWERGRWLIRG